MNCNVCLNQTKIISILTFDIFFTAQPEKVSVFWNVLEASKSCYNKLRNVSSCYQGSVFSEVLMNVVGKKKVSSRKHLCCNLSQVCAICVYVVQHTVIGQTPGTTWPPQTPTAETHHSISQVERVKRWQDNLRIVCIIRTMGKIWPYIFIITQCDMWCLLRFCQIFWLSICKLQRTVYRGFYILQPVRNA